MATFREGDFPGWHILAPHQQTFLRELYLEKHIEEDEVARYVALLVEPNKIVPQIEDLTLRLHMRELGNFNKRPESVIRGLELVKEFIDKYRDDLRREEAVVYVYGSLQYGDPRNLDFDVELVTQAAKPSSQLLANTMTGELAQIWGFGSRDDGSVDYLSLEGIEEASQRSLQGISTRITPDCIDMALTAVILSGIPIFDSGVRSGPDTYELYTRHFLFQQQAHDLVAKNPLLGAMVVGSLTDCLAERESREK